MVIVSENNITWVARGLISTKILKYNLTHWQEDAYIYETKVY